MEVVIGRVVVVVAGAVVGVVGAVVVVADTAELLVTSSVQYQP